jgi:transcriptional regulator with XRE-family HTH domain
MANSFNKLKGKLSLKARKKVSARAKKMLAAMPLQELRIAKRLSQEHLAEVLDTKQANISRIERRTDMYISTLRNYIEAMGGELEIVAKFRDGAVYISQFKDIKVREVCRLD